jgi:hypothetical protein
VKAKKNPQGISFELMHVVEGGKRNRARASQKIVIGRLLLPFADLGVMSSSNANGSSSQEIFKKVRQYNLQDTRY